MASAPTSRAWLAAHAASLLMRRPHTAQEIRRKLEVVCIRTQRRVEVRAAEAAAGKKRKRQRSTPPDIAEISCSCVASSVVEELVTDGYLNDNEFALWFIRERMQLRPRSRTHITGELAAKGVDRETIDIALEEEEFDEFDACRKLASRRNIGRDEKRTIQYLLRKGFPYDIVREALESLKESDTESELE